MDKKCLGVFLLLIPSMKPFFTLNRKRNNNIKIISILIEPLESFKYKYVFLVIRQ